MRQRVPAPEPPCHDASAGFPRRWRVGMTETMIRPIRRCGAVGVGGDRVRWRVWAPKAESVELVLPDGAGRRATRMRPEGDGHFVHDEKAPEGQRYCFRLDGG